MSLSQYLSSRIKSVKKIMARRHLDAVIFSDINNIRYLTGFTGSEGTLLVGQGESVLLVDGRYTLQAAGEVQGVAVSEYKNIFAGIEKAAKKLGARKLGFEAGATTVEAHQRLTGELKKTVLIPLSSELKLLRARKDKYEIATMKKAALIASGAMAEIIARIRPGWTELEAARQFELEARSRGADGIAFETIVASGENGALPHARPSNRKIEKGDFVVIDFGVRYRGYCSDETCTLAFGELTVAKKNAYRATLRAHDEAIAGIREGVAAASVDRLVRDVLGKKYSRYFVHSTGHGVGLEVHEAPRLALQSQEILSAGMIVTVEPGIYCPGRWGIRIEDTVLVKKNGCEAITKLDKKLTVIE